MDELKPKSGRGQDPGGGLRAPAKGESSSSEVPLDNDGATFIELPPRRPPADPGATVIHPDASREGGTSARIPSGPRSYVTSYQNVVLQEGDVLGGRYEILALLGEGGMGAVYKAKDREVERVVALKLIRPEMASNPAILARFKQELMTAHQVTHKNVIRIYDLSEADGVKFITMEFVEGSDLRQLYRDQGKLPPDEAVDIIRQVCMALDAAHTAGIIHRDLKPQNIMRDKAGRILVMDFGLARSIQSEGMTQTGALLGTIEYMSPEQAMGKTLDQRSDLFAVGLIFYELLSGKMPFKAETAMASLLMRNQERAVPLADIDATVPAGLSDIVSRCLERDLERRYPSAAEIIADLDAWQGKRPVMASIVMQAPKQPRVIPWNWIVPAATLLALSGLFLAIPRTRHMLFSTQVAGGRAGLINTSLPALSQGKFVAVMPFRVIGDPASLGNVAYGVGEALSAKLFQVKDVRLTSPTETAKIDPKTPLPQVAKDLGVNLIVHGTVQGSSDNLRITVNLENLADDRHWSQEFTGVSGDVLTLEDQIFAKLVDALEARTTDKELAAVTAHPTENIEAYNLYLKGRNALGGTPDQKTIQAAMNFFEGALQKDPNFALAYSGLADANLAMYVQKKDKYWSEKAVDAAKRAEQLNGRLPEVHFALGSAYAVTGQTVQAIAEDKRALELAPNSDEAYRRLGNAYMANGQKAEAIQALEKAVELNPYYWYNQSGLGNAYYRFGELDKAVKAFQQIVQLEPDNPVGYSDLGSAYFTMGKYDEGIAAFQKSLQIKPTADIYTNLGTGFFYLKRYTEALPMFEKAVAMNPEDETTMGNLADGYRIAGNTAKAQETYDRAIGLAYKALRVNPRDADVAGRMALYYAKKGDTQQADVFVKRARAINPADASLIYNSAVVKTLANQPAEAVKELGLALQKGYPIKDAAAEPEFAPLQSRPDYQALMKKFTSQKK
jgi:tetratricopeptide (TPR) repeat protein/TolB-like protein/predicted Ser/Thr protein kinase